ncbi:hypothetical protein HPSA_05055 [Helicobacter pylori SouthAfrica7]|uniref:Uncharacterized protein n=1 Tax=Helicobacter pylori (strain SouthAfrica7) TaxID=907239 RepID=E8QSM4_HELPW|nr:hypothetical protein HPSA_05055 [Helicobacter pylori SouthAfrica7]
MKAFLFEKDLTTRHTKAWANSQSLYYNTFLMHHAVFNDILIMSEDDKK